MDEKTAGDGSHDMNLNFENLEGYVEPSKMQKDVISHLSNRRDVIMHNFFDPGKIAVYCSGILQRPWPEKNGCLVVAPISVYVHEIVAVMTRLGQKNSVKVETCSARQITVNYLMLM